MALEETELHLVDSIDEASALMRWLNERPANLGAIGFDTEGTGLSPERDHVRLVQISDDTTGWAIPFGDWRGLVKEIVSRWDHRYRMHNAPYDCAMMKSMGIDIPRHLVDDTRIAGHVLEPTESTALKNQASRHVDPRAAMMQRALDEVMDHWTWATIPITKEGPTAAYWQYGAIDPILTYQLGDVHLPRVRSEAPRAYELELAVSFVTNDMSRNGTKIDRPYTQQQSDVFLEYVDNLGKWCVDNYGVKPGSSQEIIKIIQDDGIQMTKRTKSGALSLDKEVLAEIDHPLAGVVLRRRQAQKLQSTYLRRFLEHSVHDGLLHPSINSIGGSGKSTGASEGLYGVRTGRMSMDQPNLQQLPRKSDQNTMAKVIRNCITSRDDNFVLIMCDQDQIEMRILAHLSKDPNMIKAFGHSVDFFTQLARQMYHDDTLAKSDPRRQVTKNAGYAKAYYAGVATFAWTAGITESEARAFLEQFDALYPGANQYHENTLREARQNMVNEGVAYVRSELTSRKYVADPGKEYALINHKIQGMAAEIFKWKILELNAAGLGKYMILPVHDEIIFDVPKSEEYEVIQTIREVMNDNRMLTVPITAGIAHGSRWGEKVEL